jgi:hypothetical protein
MSDTLQLVVVLTCTQPPRNESTNDYAFLSD